MSYLALLCFGAKKLKYALKAQIFRKVIARGLKSSYLKKMP